MTTFDELKKSSRRPELVISLSLRGDLFPERDRLRSALVEAQREASDSLGGSEAVTRARDLLEGVEAEMAAHVHGFTFRAMPAKQFRALEDKHPPDPDTGELATEFLTALVAQSLIDPELTVEQLDELGFHDGVLRELESAAMRVNRDSGAPFSPAGSPPTRA